MPSTLRYIFIAFLVCLGSVFAQKSDITQKNGKRFNTPAKAKELKENAAGDEPTYKNYQNKPARPESKEDSKKVDLTPAAVKRKAAELKENGTGDAPVPPKEKNITSSPPPKTQFIDNNRELERSKTKEIKDNAVGDIDVQNVKKEKPNLTKGIRTFEAIDNQPEIRKRNGHEAASSTGDVSEAVWKGKLNTVKDKGKAAGSDAGKINAQVLDKIKDHMKTSDREMGSNQGDQAGAYQKMLSTEKDNGHKQAVFQGKTIVRADLRKQKSKEMAENQGDIIGGYLAMRNKEKSKSKQIANYSGKIDLSKITAKAKENSHKQATHIGNISISSKRKGTHPSSLYQGGRTSENYAGKEKMRKNAIKKARRNRDVEDPAYMKKPAPRPRYETEEYKIWETKTR